MKYMILWNMMMKSIIPLVQLSVLSICIFKVTFPQSNALPTFRWRRYLWSPPWCYSSSWSSSKSSGRVEDRRQPQLFKTSWFGWLISPQIVKLAGFFNSFDINQNIQFSTDAVPHIWKLANVVLVFKHGDKFLINHRPLSLTSSPCKNTWRFLYVRNY